MLQVNLQFTENALPVVVEEGIAKSSGARCSRSILESIVTEAMFEVLHGTTTFCVWRYFWKSLEKYFTHFTLITLRLLKGGDMSPFI